MDFGSSMASLVTAPVVNNFVFILKKHLDFLLSSKEYAREINKRMDQLNLTEKELQEKLQPAFANDHVVSNDVGLWLQDVKMMKAKVERIPVDGFGVLKRYEVTKKVNTILSQIKALKEKKFEILTNERPSLAKLPPTSSPYAHIQSRDLIFKNVLKFLEPNNESQKIVALHGFGGMGKTTMLEQLKKVVHESKKFDWVVKVNYGENASVIDLQQAIAEYVGEDLVEITIDTRANHLREMFDKMSRTGQHRILVMIDNLWEKVDLKDVGLTSPLPYGFKLLFTSQSQYVCTQMGVDDDSVFELDTLMDSDAKSLFFEIVGPSLPEGNDPELQKIGEDIVKECQGLPITLKTIANYLRDNMDAWKETLSNLQRYDLQDLYDPMHKVFEISYDNLKTVDDKAIFILSGLFPSHFNIHIEDLMMYGWGLKLFTDVYTLEEARERVTTCVKNLLHANLLMASEIKGFVKMHDLVHSFVSSKFSEKLASIDRFERMSGQKLTKDANDSYDRILVNCKGMFEFPLDFTTHDKLSLLVLKGDNRPLKFPKDLYKRMKRLEVVSYQNMHIPLLPRSFEHSTKLRTLYLHSCSLIDDDILFLGSLRNLEILSLVDCELKRLPSSIGKLVKLKLLDLTGCTDLHIDDEVFENMKCLEELYMRASNKSPLRLSNANCKELEYLLQRLFALELEFFGNNTQLETMSFENLNRFRISVGCRLEHVERCSFSNTLGLVAHREELLECKINELFVRTEDLKLQVNGINQLSDVSTHRSFSNLRRLHVYRCVDLTSLFTLSVANGLNKLEQLTISECPILRALIGENSEDEVIRFEKLNSMTLECLPNMVSFSNNWLKLPEMVELTLDGLPNFISIYPDDDNNMFEIQALLNKKVVLPKLEKLIISSMENLKQIWPCTISTTSMLREIKVRCCDALMNIFPNNPFPLLNHLEQVKVEECGSIEVLFNIDIESVNVDMEGDRRLRSIEVSDLDELKELWRMKGIQKHGILINGFNGVESIEIRNCKRFTNLFTPTTAKFDLKSLTNYTTINIGGDLDGKDTKNNMIEVESEQQINYGYPSYPLCTFQKLQHLELHGDERVEKVVFDMDSQPQLLHSHLMVLKLFNLNDMSHVWKCNWNKFLISQPQPFPLPFQNLTHIYLHYCHKITYLFSPLMEKYLSNLKCVDIYICHGIEEVVSSRDDEREENTASTSSGITTRPFPQLDNFKVYYLQRLNRIHYGSRDGALSNIITQGFEVFCLNSKHISIEKCCELKILFPWYVASHVPRLEELIIDDCGTMIEVFESRSSNNSSNVDDGSAHGITSTSTSPTLNTTTLVPHLANLKSVSIYNCDLLPYLFTFSTLESLKQLQVLRIKRCASIKVVVKEDRTVIASQDIVVFPRLHTLELDHLPNLKAFFLGKNDFQWPALDNVTIKDCPQLMVFTTGRSRTQKLKHIRTSFGIFDSVGDVLNPQTTIGSSSYPIVWEGMPEMKHITLPSSSDIDVSKGPTLSSHNLKEINMEYANVETVIPSHTALQLLKLESIRLTNSYRVKEVFGVALREKNDGGSIESKNVIEIPNLRQVYLQRLRGLKYLYKSNESVVLSFPNLTTLFIHDCTRLEHVFTSSMIHSLVRLHDLHISECDSLEVIVKDDEERYDKVPHIMLMLPYLKSLKLNDLPILKGFFSGKENFSCPSLDTLQIKKCQKITYFTQGDLATPALKVIDTDLGMCYIRREDVNSFIKTKQEEITISEWPPSSFHELKEINIDLEHANAETVWPSNAQLQLEKLESIRLANIIQMEEVFGVALRKTIDDGSNESQTIIQVFNLRQVYLHSLHRLKYLYKSNPSMILEFPSLTTLSIHVCAKLEYVFTSSMVGSLVCLRDLHISECNSLEVIVKDDLERDAKGNEKVKLPHLKSLKLFHLPILKGFFLGIDDVVLKSLKTLQIKKCPTIMDFTKGKLDTRALIFIETSFGMFKLREDVNSFVKTKQEEGQKF